MFSQVLSRAATKISADDASDSTKVLEEARNFGKFPPR